MGNITPIVKNLIIINVLCWLATIVLPKVDVDLINLFGLHYWKASDFNLFQMVSYMFLHSVNSISHLFFNMFALFMFGQSLEHVLGQKRFLIYYMVTGIGAGLIQELTWTLELQSVTEEISAIAASGIPGGVRVSDMEVILYLSTPIHLLPNTLKEVFKLHRISRFKGSPLSFYT